MTHKIIGKYIKELEFNIPNPKTFFLLTKNIANYKINIGINSVPCFIFNKEIVINGAQPIKNFIQIINSLNKNV